MEDQTRSPHVHGFRRWPSAFARVVSGQERRPSVRSGGKKSAAFALLELVQRPLRQGSMARIRAGEVLYGRVGARKM